MSLSAIMAIAAASWALNGASAPMQEPSLEVTVNYIVEKCASYVHTGDGSLRDNMGVSISNDVINIQHVDTLDGYDFSSSIDVNDVYFQLSEGGIDVYCLSAVMGNEQCVARNSGGRVNHANIRCRDIGRVLNALEHFQQLKGGKRQSDDPFAN